MTDSSESRQRLLAAAARVYAKHGYLGATTRRIAEEAALNEVTLFRLFGSKEALVEEAIRVHAVREPPGSLPELPEDPEAELTKWCRAEILRLRHSRDLLRQCFAETGAHSQVAGDALGGMVAAGAELRRYVGRLFETGIATLRHNQDAASVMLLSALFSDALARDDLSEIFAITRSEAPAMYARVFLRAIGVAPRSQ